MQLFTLLLSPFETEASSTNIVGNYIFRPKTRRLMTSPKIMTLMMTNRCRRSWPVGRSSSSRSRSSRAGISFRWWRTRCGKSSLCRLSQMPSKSFKLTSESSTPVFLKKMGQSQPFFNLFPSFQTNITIFATNICEKSLQTCESSQPRNILFQVLSIP